MADTRRKTWTDPSTTLGEQLRLVRDAHGLSLRAVESATGISNAYLSQLETGKIEKPSPNFLYKLAEVYGVPYEQLMEKAGYIGRKMKKVQSRQKVEHRTLSGAALSAISDLTPEEEHALMEYISFLRSRRPRS